MEFKTKISKIDKEGVIIRGEPLGNLIQNNFSDNIFFLISKRKPNDTESRIFSALLTSIIDHGIGTTSSLTSRFVISAGNPLNTSVGAGILALGEKHGGAVEKAMNQIKFLADDTEKKLTEILDKKEIIYGFGHSIYKESDPRVNKIISLCHLLNYNSKFIELAKLIEKIIENKKGKKLCLNIDGLMAAILLEMGFSPIEGRGIFIIGRTPGLVAQCIEEKEENKLRRIDEKEINYEGKP